ncbi:glycogen debranching protein GlgX [Jannaschia sp. R86511]|uniref:glycogen debranching protein GlgX n=1 Tax=Jannaschia sp. R86511 TaxID=3093853 RepID=UPI0036D3E2B0
MVDDAGAPQVRVSGPGRPYPLGCRPVGDGVDVAVLAAHAERVELCLLSPDPTSPTGWAEQRLTLPAVTDGVHHGHVSGVGAGQRYVLRAHGPWDPARGQRHNPDKVLLDPYARVLEGAVVMGPAVKDHVVVDDRPSEQRSRLDSLGHTPVGVVVADPAPLADDRPHHPWSRTVVLETHVRGLTMRMPGVPPELRGTYAGLAHPTVLAHLQRLGVTAVELLPVHASTAEEHLAARGAVNYWGYNTLSYFAPEPRYSAAVRRGEDASAVLTEFRDMVRAMHAAGVEVLLDVVYNHTCEGGVGGPTLSWRGLDNATYYRTDGGAYRDVTGTGNSLDSSQPEVVRLTMDSLRWWVQQMGVDGFRFDLAPALARRADDTDGTGGWDPDHPFFVAARTDPVLAGTKLVAEPWDIGAYGWRTGQFPVPFADWNDRYRDSVRDFWLAGSRAELEGRPGPGVRDLATRLVGSEDLFGGPRRTGARSPLAGVNFIAAHDGFTLADLVTYDHKHNEANGEDNRDGHGHNLSWNHGHEGPTDDPVVTESRRRTLRALLGTLAVSTGVPMLLAGDELGRTQRGNNNGYCLDDATTWHDWQLAPWQRDLTDTTAFLLRLRAQNPVLRQDRFFGPRPERREDGTRDVGWFDGDGDELAEDDWSDPWRRTLLMFLNGDGVAVADRVTGPDGAPLRPASFLVVLHGGAHRREVQLPEPPWAERFRPVWSSEQARPVWPAGPGGGFGVPPRDELGGTRVAVPPRSLTVLRAIRP